MSALPAIYGITATGLFEDEGAFLASLEKALASGTLGMLQVRARELSDTQLARFAAACVARCKPHGCKVILNHPEPKLAREAGADGIHLASRWLPEPAGERAGLLVGASCHDERELQLACERHGCDFVVLSPVRRTLSHVDARPLGWERFAQLASSCPVPVYALGGLALGDVEEARRMGACGLASMRDVWGLPLRTEMAA